MFVIGICKRASEERVYQATKAQERKATEKSADCSF